MMLSNQLLHLLLNMPIHLSCFLLLEIHPQTVHLFLFPYNISLSMNPRSNKPNRKSKRQEFDNLYQTISLQTRTSLIEKVIIERISVYRAAIQLELNQSTAKAIVRRFRRKGSIYVRKDEVGLHGEVDRIKRLVSVREKNMARSTTGERSQEISAEPEQMGELNQEDQPRNLNFMVDQTMLYYQYLAMNWNQLIFPVIF